MKYAKTATAVAILIVTQTILVSGCKTKSILPSFMRSDDPILSEAGESFSSETNPEFQQTASGLRYRTMKAGTGRNPTAASTVTVHYKGWLDDNTTFDSSYSRGPATFPLSGVVPGWTEGLQLVGEGGTIELEVPSELGYGERGSPPKIPPGATLHFLVELISVD